MRADGAPADLTRSVAGIAASPVEPLLDAPRDIGPLSPFVLREIAYRVLTGPRGARLRQIVAATAGRSG